MSKTILPSIGLTITPSTIEASEFGGGSGDLGDYVSFDLDYDASQYQNRLIKVAGTLPIESDDIGFGEDDKLGKEITIVRSEDTVTTGTSQFTFTVTISALDESNQISATVTITSGSGDGVAFEQQTTI